MWQVYKILKHWVKVHDSYGVFACIPREVAGGLSREYVLRIPSVS